MLNIPRDEAHEYYGAIFKAQHKCLPDVSGMRKGYEIYLNQHKAECNAAKLNKQENICKQVSGEQGMARRNS